MTTLNGKVRDRGTRFYLSLFRGRQYGPSAEGALTRGEEVAARSLAIRMANGWTQGEAARRSGMSQGRVCRIERGERVESEARLIRLAGGLGVRSMVLLDKSDQYLDPQARAFLPAIRAWQKVTHEISLLKTRKERSAEYRDVGACLSAARMVNGWTQDEAAKRSGLSQTTLRRIERGEQLSKERVIRFVVGLAVQPKFLKQIRAFVSAVRVIHRIDQLGSEEERADAYRDLVAPFIAVRVANGWTQDEAAKRSDMSQASVSWIERGERFEADAAVKLADGLGIQPEVVFDGKYEVLNPRARAFLPVIRAWQKATHQIEQLEFEEDKAEAYQEHGARFTAARKVKRWTQHEAAKKSGLSATTVGRIERGERVEVEGVVRLSVRLGVIPEFLGQITAFVSVVRAWRKAIHQIDQLESEQKKADAYRELVAGFCSGLEKATLPEDRSGDRSWKIGDRSLRDQSPGQFLTRFEKRVV